MRKTITYSGFIVATLVVVLAFVTATTYTQLALAIFIYPLVAYFALRLFPRKASWKEPMISVQLPKLAEKVEAETATTTPKESVAIADIDRRAFLKLIGVAGISLFVSSILFRRAEAPLFGTGTASGSVSIKDVSDHVINPAERQPTDGYRIVEIDDSVISYYGFLNKDGAWFIMREDTDNGSFRYTKGDINFSSAWARHELLAYDYFDKVF